MATRGAGAFSHEEADITMVFCVSQAAKYGKDIMLIEESSLMTQMCLSYRFTGDTLQHCSARSRWSSNGTVLDLNVTCIELEPQSVCNYHLVWMLSVDVM